MQPSLVIVYFGGNDSMGPHPSGLGPHVPLTEYIENMKNIALHLKVFNFFPFYLYLTSALADITELLLTIVLSDRFIR